MVGQTSEKTEDVDKMMWFGHNIQSSGKHHKKKVKTRVLRRFLCIRLSSRRPFLEAVCFKTPRLFQSRGTTAAYDHLWLLALNLKQTVVPKRKAEEEEDWTEETV